ncbi:MAG: UDP-glucose 6-dehydrogenase [Lentisphaeria bacterium]|nr:UDP-glucose 6-dehydrogenase [Lentisphaeria bacterium]
MEKETITVGIIGCGFVGGALKRWLDEHNPKVKIVISDPPKGFNDDLNEADVFFISLHVPTEEDGSQDLSLMESIIKTLPDKPIFIRTTILPGTSEQLSRNTNHQVYFMPEFLTERTAYIDFCSQPMVFTAEQELLQKIFVGKKFIEMSSLEAEITKYAHNVFGALKVTYFNGIYELCNSMEANYRKVQQGLLLSGYINTPHSQVPGPDGKLGYGGKCFPKDVNAFTELFREKELSLYDLLKVLKPLNIHYRGEDK